MPNKKIAEEDAKLKAFIQAGGRKGAEADFNSLLKHAVKPKKAASKAPTKKKK